MPVISCSACHRVAQVALRRYRCLYRRERNSTTVSTYLPQITINQHRWQKKSRIANASYEKINKLIRKTHIVTPKMSVPSIPVEKNGQYSPQLHQRQANPCGHLMCKSFSDLRPPALSWLPVSTHWKWSPGEQVGSTCYISFNFLIIEPRGCSQQVHGRA